MEKKVFLCSFCGITIKSNLNNLIRHEQLHKPYVSKIQCAADNCELSFCNKGYYWTHWTQKHSEMTMPDILKHTSVARKQRKPYTRKAKSYNIGNVNNIPGKKNIDKPEKSNDALNPDVLTKHTQNLNIENIIEDCFVRNPFYGVLN